MSLCTTQAAIDLVTSHRTTDVRESRAASISPMPMQKAVFRIMK